MRPLILKNSAAKLQPTRSTKPFAKENAENLLRMRKLQTKATTEAVHTSFISPFDTSSSLQALFGKVLYVYSQEKNLTKRFSKPEPDPTDTQRQSTNIYADPVTRKVQHD